MTKQSTFFSDICQEHLSKVFVHFCNWGNIHDISAYKVNVSPGAALVKGVAQVRSHVFDGRWAPHLTIKSWFCLYSWRKQTTLIPVNFSGIMGHRLIWMTALLTLVSVNLSSQSKNLFSYLRRSVSSQDFYKLNSFIWLQMFVPFDF